MDIVWFAIFVMFILTSINAIVAHANMHKWGTTKEQIEEFKIMRAIATILGVIIINRILTELPL